MKIIIDNPSLSNLEMSYLSYAYQAGVETVSVRNNDRFTNGRRIQIGRMGSEQSEVVTIDSVVIPGNEVNVTATLFPHGADDPIYQLKYDQVRVYRSTTGADGSYEPLATVNIDVDNENLRTIYDDVNGLSSYYYRIAYYDSIDDIESTLSDPIPGTGYDRDTAGSLVNEFFEEVGDKNQQNMSVQEALGIMNEVNDDLVTASRRPFRWLYKKTDLSTTGGSNRVDIPEDVYKIDRIGYRSVDGVQDRTDNYRILTPEEFEYVAYDNTFGQDNNLHYVTLDEASNEIVLFPTPHTSQSDVITLWYWSKPDNITSMSQKLQTPTTRIYKLYLLSKYYRKRSVKESSFIGISDRYFNDYTGEIVKMQRANKLDIGSPKGMRPDTRHSRGLRRF